MLLAKSRPVRRLHSQCLKRHMASPSPPPPPKGLQQFAFERLACRPPPPALPSWPSQFGPAPALGLPSQRLKKISKNEISDWNAYAEAGDIKAVRRKFEQFVGGVLPRSGVVPTSIWNMVLKAYSKAGDYPGALKWIKTMDQCGVKPNLSTAGKLLAAATRAGLVHEAEHLAQVIIDLGMDTVIMYNTIMFSFAKVGKTKEAVKWYSRMTAARFQPTRSTYNILIRSCVNAGDVVGAQEWFDEIAKQRLKPSLYSYNSVLDCLSRKSHWPSADTWFERIRDSGMKPDAFSYFLMVNAHSKQGDMEECLGWFRRMCAFGLKPNNAVYKSVMRCAAKNGDVQRVKCLLRELIHADVMPDRHSYSVGIDTCRKIGDTEEVARFSHETGNAKGTSGLGPVRS